MTSATSAVFIIAFLNIQHVQKCLGHGYMSDPPGRSSAWRFGFGTPKNDNDNQVTCGRVTVSECGVCGDGLDKKRDNENGGKYGTGTIVETYKAGATITTTTKITANHGGWFEFSICRLQSPEDKATEACLQPLKVLEGNPPPDKVQGWETKWSLPMGVTGDFEVELQLPPGFTCDHCVMRWLWNCGNDWKCGVDGTGRERCGLGFGPKQEKFYSCADIAITADGSTLSTKGTTKPTKTTATTSKAWWTTTMTATKKGQFTTRNNGFTTSRVTNSQTICVGAADGALVADPANCCGYVVCLYPNTRHAKAVARDCALGTAWRPSPNGIGGVCDHEYNVACRGRSSGRCRNGAGGGGGYGFENIPNDIIPR